MTTQGALVLAGIVSAFVVFGIVLAWADFYSRRGGKQSSEKPLAANDQAQTTIDERRAA